LAIDNGFYNMSERAICIGYRWLLRENYSR